MQIKRNTTSWGEEVIIGEGARVVRIYRSAKKVTIDLSQVRDNTWDKFQSVQKKYPGTRKVVLPADTDVQPLIQWFMKGELQ